MKEVGFWERRREEGNEKVSLNYDYLMMSDSPSVGCYSLSLYSWKLEVFLHEFPYVFFYFFFFCLFELFDFLNSLTVLAELEM